MAHPIGGSSSSAPASKAHTPTSPFTPSFSDIRSPKSLSSPLHPSSSATQTLNSSSGPTTQNDEVSQLRIRVAELERANDVLKAEKKSDEDELSLLRLQRKLMEGLDILPPSPSSHVPETASLRASVPNIAHMGNGIRAGPMQDERQSHRQSFSEGVSFSQSPIGSSSPLNRKSKSRVVVSFL